MCSCNDTNERRCCGTPPRQKSIRKSCLQSSFCTGERPRGPRTFGKCQCAAEDSWERCSPPRPKREWANNFNELRRRWSEHARRQKCPCKDCKRKTIKPLEDRRQICPNQHFDNEEEEEEDDEDPGYRSSSNKGCSSHLSRRHRSRRCYSPECRSEKTCSDKDCQLRRHDDDENEKLGGYCLCQPMMRGCRCCCSTPVRIDVRSRPECDCECPTRIECPCPPSERRFPKSNKCCAVVETCRRSVSPYDESCGVEKNVKCMELTQPKQQKSNVKQSSRTCCSTPLKRNSCNTSPGRGIVALVSFALLILIAVAWTINILVRATSLASTSMYQTRRGCVRRRCRFF